MAKSFSFPAYQAETIDGKIIAGPSLDCGRMNLAARTYAHFEGVKTRTMWVKTLTPKEARIFLGENP
jgi:hypothetical protein